MWLEEIQRSQIVAVFEALLDEKDVEQPPWWSAGMVINFGGISAGCAASANGPGRIVLYPFVGSREEVRARLSGEVRISVWEDPF